MAERPAEKVWDDWVEHQLIKVAATLAFFEASPPNAGGRVTIVDVSLGALLGYLDYRFDDFGWRGRYPNLAEWLKPVAARPSFVATLPS